MTRHDTDDTTMDRRTTTDDRETANRTMGDVSHTNPKTGESFGDSPVFERGTVIIADGGVAEGERTDEDVAMADVDHVPREGAPEANTAYTRGIQREEPGAETATNAGDKPN